MSNSRLQRVIELIDAANGCDPNSENVEGTERPAELVYCERMSATLGNFAEAPNEHLQIAVRAQHLERWMSPRSNYPEGRAGYLKWRTELKQYHANRAGELMQEAGYEQSDTDRVATLIGKRGIKRDPDVQALEDVACLTFLQHYASEFIEPHHDEKVLDILSKTARKMSPLGLSAAAGLKLSGRLADLLTRAMTDNHQ